MAFAIYSAVSHGHGEDHRLQRGTESFTGACAPSPGIYDDPPRLISLSPSVSKPVISVRNRQLSARDQCNWRIGASKQDGLAPPRHVRYPRWPARKTAGESHHGVGSRCDASGVNILAIARRAPAPLGSPDTQDSTCACC